MISKVSNGMPQRFARKYITFLINNHDVTSRLTIAAHISMFLYCFSKKTMVNTLNRKNSDCVQVGRVLACRSSSHVLSCGGLLGQFLLASQIFSFGHH